MAITDLGIELPTGTGLTGGLPALLTGSLVTLHSVPVSETHEVYLWVNNPTAGDISCTVRLTDGTNRDLIITVPAETTKLILPGPRCNDTIDIQASGNGLLAFFAINRVD